MKSFVLSLVALLGFTGCELPELHMYRRSLVTVSSPQRLEILPMKTLAGNYTIAARGDLLVRIQQTFALCPTENGLTIGYGGVCRTEGDNPKTVFTLNRLFKYQVQGLSQLFGEVRIQTSPLSPARYSLVEIFFSKDKLFLVPLVFDKEKVIQTYLDYRREHRGGWVQKEIVAFEVNNRIHQTDDLLAAMKPDRYKVIELTPATPDLANRLRQFQQDQQIHHYDIDCDVLLKSKWPSIDL